MTNFDERRCADVCCAVLHLEAMRALKFHGDVGGAWLALDKDT